MTAASAGGAVPAVAAPTTRRAAAAAVAGRVGSAAEARWMVEHVAGGADALDGDQLAALETLVARRSAGEPLQYLLGAWPFRTVELAVDRRALIPRPETEQVVEVALGELRRAGAGRGGAGRGGAGRGGAGRGGAGRGGAGGRAVAVDLGTGTGAIALSIAVELGGELGRAGVDLEVWAVDADGDALALAAENAARVAAATPSAGIDRRVHLVEGRWFSPLPGRLRGGVDLVVANPPYVAEDEWADLAAEVRCEPRQALVAPAGSDGTPGLATVEAVLSGARDWLCPGGAAVVELAPHQAAAAADLARRLGYAEVALVADLAGRDRAVVARP